MASTFVCFTTYPDPEDGPIFINAKLVQAVLPSSSNPGGYDDHTLILMASDKMFRVAETLDEVVGALSQSLAML